tara:strand:- start:815 stop:1312 length:498 start_codon:yes stop_codon:yes gene_type:complete
MKNSVILFAGVLLVLFGCFGEQITNSVFSPNIPVVEGYVVDAPANKELLDKARVIIDILNDSNDSTTRMDCLKLSSLYSDLATLVELDADDQVVKDTATIKEANGLSGKMLRLDIKDKYPGLAEASKDLVVTSIGEDDVALDKDTRSNAVDAFRALSWAFYEGSK